MSISIMYQYNQILVSLVPADRNMLWNAHDLITRMIALLTRSLVDTQLRQATANANVSTQSSDTPRYSMATPYPLMVKVRSS